MKMEEYMKMPYRLELVEDKVEGGYVASYPELPGCITLGDTLEDAVNNATDAKKEWLLAAIEEGIDIPLPDAANSFSASSDCEFQGLFTSRLQNAHALKG